MLPLHMAILCCAFALLFGSTARADDAPRFVLDAKPGAAISPLLFGQFLERASFGEPGPEHALVPGTRTLQPKVLDLLKDMNIPLIRFPGGTDVDYIDWRDMIDNAPSRTAATRPSSVGNRGNAITNNFGMDEFFALQGNLNCQALLVVNFRDALLKQIPLEDAALRAASLVAYTNAPQGAKLPDGMPDYPALRAKNGHPEPYGVKYFQIGNELWFYADSLLGEPALGIKTHAEATEWFATCLITFADHMRAVDPSIELILDGPRPAADSVLTLAAANPEVHKRIQYLTVHAYGPGSTDQVRKDGHAIWAQKLTDDEYWNAWVTVPGAFSSDGFNVGIASSAQTIAKLGYKTACTEWNWNGFGFTRIKRTLGINPANAAAIGTAGFLHGLLRDAENVQLATQSLLLGSRWDIAVIRVDPTGVNEPFYLPQGIVTTFYAKHHGRHLVGLHAQDIPTFSQPYQVGEVSPTAKVAVLDAVATLDDEALYLHIINRDRNRAMMPTFDLSALALHATEAMSYQLSPATLAAAPSTPADSDGDFFGPAVLVQKNVAIRITPPTFAPALPPASITIFRIPRR